MNITAAEARVRRGVAFRRARDPPVAITLILYFFSPIFRMQCVSTVLIYHIKPLFFNYEKKSLSTSQSNAQWVLFAPLILQNPTEYYFHADSARSLCCGFAR